MNFKSPLRRTAVLTAGALIGLSGAFALAGPASAHHNEVSGVAKCDTVTGDWLVTWTVNAKSGYEHNPPTYKWTKVALTPEDTKIDNAKLAVTGEELADNQPLTGVQRVSAKHEGASLTVGAEWSNRNVAEKTGKVTFEGKCEKTPGEEPPPPVDEEPPATPEEPTTPPEVPADLPGEPEPIFEADCDTMTIGLDNPVDGVKFTLKFKTSKGEERTLVIKPGEKKSETFSATPGFSIKLTFTATVQGQSFSETTTIEYEQPNDCDSDGGGGGLPLTGAAAGSIAGGAGGLLAVGAGLFFMARRRKVKFTA
ncbi:cell wall anchor protein [Actinoplanes sp. ATCC 53533]|uniref:LPXTG cell wall anchor domain-containing protein n=1 Tax=Actinoplanes sp. ATCC 53533 TaxID=1288362 RepID=UPI000F78433E|nr:LPXTG cell wall anchor domain-containing protein [Actinoplanes sp. ATCC 53533]RSM48525.1 cell wall anchor protein [Actinoplanes sp. ATCC 53533]